jgi:hypothetical protein
MLGLRQIQLKLPLNEKKQMIIIVTITAQIPDLLQSLKTELLYKELIL